MFIFWFLPTLAFLTDMTLLRREFEREGFFSKDESIGLWKMIVEAVKMFAIPIVGVLWILFRGIRHDFINFYAQEVLKTMDLDFSEKCRLRNFTNNLMKRY